MKTSFIRLCCALALLFVGRGSITGQAAAAAARSQLPNLKPLAPLRFLDGVANP
jgi:hypothetical protein